MPIVMQTRMYVIRISRRSRSMLSEILGAYVFLIGAIEGMVGVHRLHYVYSRVV